MLEHFYMRKAICKLRLSAHNLLIETDRYVKPKSMPCSERICKHCNLNLIENEFHFLSQCSLYNQERKTNLYDHIKIVSEYDQEIPQSQTADNPLAQRGRATQPSRDTRKTN